MTARVIRPAFGGASAPRAPADDGAPFDVEVTGPPPEPPDDRFGGGGGGGPGQGGVADDGDFGSVTPVGVTTRRGATSYVLIDSSGLETVHSARDLYQRSVITSLFGGAEAIDFLIQRWPVPPRGKSKASTDYDVEAAGNALMSACKRGGHADSIRMRRDGVWPHPDGLLFHAGDRVLLPGRHGLWDDERLTGYRDRDAVYLFCQHRRAPPAQLPASPKEVEQLAKAIDLWRFGSSVAPQVVLGLIGCAMLGIALPWRPHVFLRGPKGSGKSSLAKVIARACGIGDPVEDITAPGLQREFDSRSGLIALDERESDADGVRQVIQIMRGSSDGEGNVKVQAAEGGGSIAFRVAGCFLFAATTMPPMTEADASRITVVQVRRSDREAQAEVDAAKALAERLHPALLLRMLQGYDRWRANFRAARGAAARMESTSRSADQVGALVAGWWTLTRDEALGTEVADRVMAPFGEILVTRAEDEAMDVPQQVLQHLLSSRVPMAERTSDQIPVYRALVRAMRAQHGLATVKSADMRLDLEVERKRSDAKLGSLGLRILLDPYQMRGWPFETEPNPGLLVAQSHPIMRLVFAHSDWPGSAWRGPLLDLPGAVASRGPVSFPGGGQHRAVFVPLRHLGIEDEELTQAE